MAEVTLRLPDELRDRLAQRVAAEGVSTQVLAEKAIRAYLERRSPGADIDAAMGRVKDRYAEVLERLGR